MNITEFASFYNLSEEAQQFIIRFDFEQIAGELTQIPETLQSDFILRQLSKLRRPEDARQILQSAEEIKSNPYLLAGYNYLCCYWWKHPRPLLYGHKLPEFAKAFLHNDAMRTSLGGHTDASTISWKHGWPSSLFARIGPANRVAFSRDTV